MKRTSIVQAGFRLLVTMLLILLCHFQLRRRPGPACARKEHKLLTPMATMSSCAALA